MTVRLLAALGQYPANAIVTFSAEVETSLVAEKLASTTLTGGVVYQLPADTGRAGESARWVTDESGKALDLLLPGVAGRGGALAVLSAAGVVVVSPADELSDAYPITTLDGMSTGTSIDVAAPGEFRKVRLYWRNISATSTRKLYVAANAENSIRGLMQGQSANRRVAELAFGDHIMLYGSTPITGLNFSSDGSVSANTHSLLIVWGN